MSIKIRTTSIRISRDVLEKAKKICEKDRIEFPSICNFVDKAVTEKLNKLKLSQK